MTIIKRVCHTDRFKDFSILIFFAVLSRVSKNFYKYRFIAISVDSIKRIYAMLAKKATTGEKISIAEQLNQNKLRSDYEELKRFVDSLPKEIKQHAKQKQIIKNKEIGGKG